MRIPLARLLLITSPVPGLVLSTGNAKRESGKERPTQHPWLHVGPAGYNRSSELQGLGVLGSARVGVRRDTVALSLGFLLSAPWV